MKNSLHILVFFILIALITNSCDTITPDEQRTCWKLKSTEYWGVRPGGNLIVENFAAFPFGISYNIPGNINITYTGMEQSVTRTDIDNTLKVTKTITFIWSLPPTIILPDTDYKMTYESKGSAGNGTGLSVPVYYNNGYQWYSGSFRDGPKTVNIKMSKPDSDPNHQKMKIAIEMSSGVSYYMNWVYVYEWIP